MRDIKFRAFDTRTKKMSPEFILFGEFILLGAVHAWQQDEEVAAGLRWDMTENHDSLMRLNDLQVMQYTGLKDKNGKEIYEGDIMKMDDRETSIGQVVYDGDAFKVLTVLGSLWKLHTKTIVTKKRQPEVIGNIYENPELVGGSK